MERRRIAGLEIVILVYLICQLATGIGSKAINDQFYDRFSRKAILKGEVIEMSYYNRTIPEVNFNIIKINQTRTEHYYNLSVRDQITNSIVYCGLEIFIIERFNIQTEDIIIIYNNPPYVEIRKK